MCRTVAALHGYVKPRYRYRSLALLHMNMWTQEEEAKRLHNRFDKLKTEKGIGQAEFARTFGLPGGASMLSQHIKGRRPISLESAVVYARGFGVPLDEISPRLAAEMKNLNIVQSIGPTSKMGTPSVILPSGSFPTNPKTAKKVWVVGKGEDGMKEKIWSDGDIPVDATDEYAEIHSTDPHAFLVRVEGSSMYPKFEEGNYALVEPATEPELEDCVLVRLSTGETMIKRLLSRRTGYKLGSFNDPIVHEFKREDVSWCYYIAHEVPRRKIKSRH